MFRLERLSPSSSGFAGLSDLPRLFEGLSCVLLLSGFPSIAVPHASADTFYVSPDGSDDDPGTRQRPRRTITGCFMQLRAGDTLIIGDGLYDERDARGGLGMTARHSGTAEAPITVKAENVGKQRPNVIWKLVTMDLIRKDLGYWTFEGVHFQSSHTTARLGQFRKKNKVHHVTFRHCHFEKEGALTLSYSDDVLIEHCHFSRIQSKQAGKDLHAIEAQHYAHRLTIRHCSFEDVSADGVQMGNNGGDIRDVLIEDCRFWINRNPDDTLADRELQQKWGNTGENGIDIKQVDPSGSVTVRRCEFHGFRPTVRGQNASGANGVALTIHLGSHNVTVDRCRFYDNTIAISVAGKGPGQIGAPKDVKIQNCLIHDNKQLGVRIGDASAVRLLHNTFARNAAHLWVTDESDGVTIVNNLFFSGRAAEGAGETRSALKADHNAWAAIRGTRPAYLQGAHDLVVGDPAIDESTFVPLPASPLIDGAQSTAIKIDYAGNPRDARPDIGAFESQRLSK